MRVLKYALIAVAAFAFTTVAAPRSSAQVSVGIDIGAPPACEWGYYGYPPYNCAPYGYYGPEWFNGGVFIGAGKWFHGPASFHGNVNRNLDPRYGYHGALPARGGAYHAPADNFKSFKPTHVADPKGGYHGAAHTEAHGH